MARKKKEEVKEEQSEVLESAELFEKETKSKTKKTTKKTAKAETKKEPKKVEKNEVKKEETPKDDKKSKKVVTPKAPKVELVNDRTIGIFSDDLTAATVDKDDEAFDMLKRAAKNKTVLYGTVIGVQSSKRTKNILISVLWNGQRITIRDEDYFEPDFDFGSQYDIKNEGESQADVDKRNQGIRASRARYQMMAVVPFVVLQASMMPITEGMYAGQKELVAIGSKREAMAQLRDYYFLHEGKRKKYPAVPKKGDMAEARVLYTKADHVLVECLGVETRIPVSEISDDYVPNCMEVVKVGETMKVKIEKIYINDDKTVYLTVTGKISEPSKAIRSIKVGDTLLGTVKMYNPKKHRYQVSLKNGVSCTVREEDVQGKVLLHPGNEVSVYVVKVMDTFISGFAIKL